jgi:hypothetical protein
MPTLLFTEEIFWAYHVPSNYTTTQISTSLFKLVLTSMVLGFEAKLKPCHSQMIPIFYNNLKWITITTNFFAITKMSYNVYILHSLLYICYYVCMFDNFDRIWRSINYIAQEFFIVCTSYHLQYYHDDEFFLHFQYS